MNRGFAQGDGPSPRLYNIGEQILLFWIEYDPNIAGVYLTYVVPREVVNNEVVFQNLDRAEETGLTVDTEVPHTNRRIPAFADEANGGLDRSKRNLELVKGILYEFGVMSGLETNVEKTTLMPIGHLDEHVHAEILELGFEMVESIKCRLSRNRHGRG